MGKGDRSCRTFLPPDSDVGGLLPHPLAPSPLTSSIPRHVVRERHAPTPSSTRLRSFGATDGQGGGRGDEETNTNIPPSPRERGLGGEEVLQKRG